VFGVEEVFGAESTGAEESPFAGAVVSLGVDSAESVPSSVPHAVRHTPTINRHPSRRTTRRMLPESRGRHK
jgi:hypothetical protein